MTTNNEKAVLFIGANRPITGREKEATGLWMEWAAWLDSQINLGWLTRWDGMWLTWHGGDLNTGFVCYGDRAKLDEWRRTDAFESWCWRAEKTWEGFGVVPGVAWGGMKETWEKRAKIVGH